MIKKRVCGIVIGLICSIDVMPMKNVIPKFKDPITYMTVKELGKISYSDKYSLSGDTWRCEMSAPMYGWNYAAFEIKYTTKGVTAYADIIIDLLRERINKPCLLFKPMQKKEIGQEDYRTLFISNPTMVRLEVSHRWFSFKLEVPDHWCGTGIVINPIDFVYDSQHKLGVTCTKYTSLKTGIKVNQYKWHLCSVREILAKGYRGDNVLMLRRIRELPAPEDEVVYCMLVHNKVIFLLKSGKIAVMSLLPPLEIKDHSNKFVDVFFT